MNTKTIVTSNISGTNKPQPVRVPSESVVRLKIIPRALSYALRLPVRGGAGVVCGVQIKGHVHDAADGLVFHIVVLISAWILVFSVVLIVFCHIKISPSIEVEDPINKSDIAEVIV